MTRRQHEAYEAWLALEWDRPSKDNWYQMVVAAETRRSYVKRPRQVKVGDFRLKFAFEVVDADGKKILSETEEMLAVKGAKHRRRGWFGGRDIQVVRISQEERDLLRSLPRDEALKLRRQWAADKTRWKEPGPEEQERAASPYRKRRGTRRRKKLGSGEAVNGAEEQS